MSALKFTQEQQSISAYVHNLIPEHGHLVYDLRDEKQYQYARMMTEKSGLSESDYPATYKLLDDIRDYQEKNGYTPFNEAELAQDGWQTAYEITTAGKNVGNDAAARGLGTVVGGFNSMYLFLHVIDNTNHLFLAHGNAHAMTPATTLLVETEKNMAYPLTEDYHTGLHYTSAPTPVNIEARGDAQSPGDSGTIIRQHRNAAVADPVLVSPKYTELSNPYGGATNNILIGLGRQWSTQGTQFNYVWAEPNVNHPLGRVPFEGHVAFDKQIKLIKPTAVSPGNIAVDIQVTDKTGGGTIRPTPSQYFDNIYPNFYLDPGDHRILHWNLPAGTSNTDKGNPVVFTSVIWNSDITALFNCTIQVTFNDNSVGYATIISTDSGQDDNPVDGTLHMHSLEFVWHCVGRETSVTLPCGKGTKPIEQFLSGDQVLVNQNGEDNVVSAVHMGDHKGKMCVITTDQGQSLTLSHNHIVITPTGGVRADMLVAGTKVLVEGGIATIVTAADEPDYNDVVYNLYVGAYTDDAVGTYFANGILVGDIVAQRKMTEALGNDPDWVLSQLGQEWATDINSYFANRK